MGELNTPDLMINDPVIIQKALEMKRCGMFVRTISNKLTKETGQQITQMALWRTFEIIKEDSLREITELDYPSRNEIEETFSETLQKYENRICVYGGKQLKRNVMIEILSKFFNKNFTFMDVQNNLYKTVDKESIYQHWVYLLKGNYIIKTENGTFKFCDRVKQWKTFGKV